MPDDLGRRLLGRLPGPVAVLLAELGEAVARGGARLWLVGGQVRDLWLGDPTADLDLVVEGAFEPAVREVAARGHVVLPKGAAFLTYRLRPAASGPARSPVPLTIDLGAARRERYLRPAALPSVEPGSLDDDLRRRDASLNAVALLLAPDAWGCIADPTGGLVDLAACRLRALHPGSFEDDPTRAFRIARFAGRYGFEIEPATAGWIEAAVSAGLVARLSGARVRAQLALLATEPSLTGPLACHERLGLLAAVHPALALDEAAAGRAVAADGAAAALAALGAPAGDPLGRLLLALLVGRPPHLAGSALARAGLHGAPAGRLVTEVERLPQLAAWLDAAPAGLPARALRDRLADLDATAVPVTLALTSPEGGARLVLWAAELASRRLRVTGRDLLALGAEPGPEIGRVLDRLLTERLEGRLGSRAAELALACRLLGLQRP